MLPRITGEAVVVMDPEVKFLDNGKTMVRLRVAAKTRKKDGDRWTDGESSFFNIVVWSPFSDNFIEMNVLKGETVVFAGTMQERLTTRTARSVRRTRSTSAERRITSRCLPAGRARKLRR